MSSPALTLNLQIYLPVKSQRIGQAAGCRVTHNNYSRDPPLSRYFGQNVNLGLAFYPTRVIGQVFKFYLEMSIVYFKQTLLVLIARVLAGTADQLGQITN